MDKKATWNAWYIIAAVFGVIFFQQVWAEYSKVKVLAYSEFQNQLKGGKVEEIRIGQNYIQGVLKDAEGNASQQFVTIRVDPELAADLDKYHVKFAGTVESTWLRDLLSWVLPVVLFFGIWM